MIYNKKLNVELNKQGTDGKNAITMTSATTPNGEYNGQVGIWQGQVYSWNGTSWVLTSGILPTDPVLHYSFDDLPSIPDGENIVYARNKNWTGTDSFAGNATISVENGCLVLDGKGVASYCFRFFETHSNCYVKIKMLYDIDGSVSLYENVTSDSTLTTLNFAANEEKTVILKLSDNNRVIGFLFTGKITIKELYIGDASYTTPIIDNSGNNHNATTTKGISVQGISGKGLQLTGNSYVDFISPLDFSKQLEYSCSCWIKDWDNTTTLYVMNNWKYYSVSPNSFRIVKTDIGVDLRFEVLFATDATKVKRYTYSVTNLENNSFVTLTVTKSGVAKLYINGTQLTNYTSADGVVAQNSNIIQIGRSMGNSAYVYSKATLDDFMLFNRALSDQEVLGLYLARGNTPKRYTFADYQNSINGGKYHSTTKPTMAFEGDYYLNTTDGYIYSYDGTTWVKITNYNDARYKMAMTDMINLAATNSNVPFLSVTNAWIKNLAAGNILADEIATQTLELKDDGVIRSTKTDANGKPLVEIKADGSSIFRNIKILNNDSSDESVDGSFTKMQVKETSYIAGTTSLQQIQCQDIGVFNGIFRLPTINPETYYNSLQDGTSEKENTKELLTNQNTGSIDFTGCMWVE